MTKPEFVYKLSERTLNGTIKASCIIEAKRILLSRGFLLLPSDTCYSVATSPEFRNYNEKINILFNRPLDWPNSLAFSNSTSVQNWFNLNTITKRLIENFTPGPLTFIIKHNLSRRIDYTHKIVRNTNGTLGVRIPDSFIEREIAASLDFPITTTAVRDPSTGAIVQNFEQALAIVEAGISKINHPEWGAIQGERFYSKHSTVVKIVDKPEHIELLREGDIKFHVLEAYVKDLDN